MSRRKINREEKRREVALSCFDVLHDYGIKKLTVAQVAKTANIGKGTVYEYFDNKEDIIFEIINIHIEEQHKVFQEKVAKLRTIKEKIELFFDFTLNDSEENMRHFEGYKDFLSIVLAEENMKMKEFNCDKNEYFRGELIKILEEGVNEGELKKDALDLADGIFTFHKGMVLRKMSQSNYNAREDFEKFINTIFKLLEFKS